MVEEKANVSKSQNLAAKILDERKKIGDLITQQLVGFEPLLSKIKAIRNGTPLKNTLEEDCTGSSSRYSGDCPAIATEHRPFPTRHEAGRRHVVQPVWYNFVCSHSQLVSVV